MWCSLTLMTIALAAPPAPEKLIVDGVERSVIVVKNSKAAPPAGAPLIFVFHGHGGTARHSHNRMGVHEHWPEAVVLYPQGLPGVSGITDPDGKQSGWQKNPGELADRDLKFFDTLLTMAKEKLGIDEKRVYVMGHSNGSRFANVIWASRGDKITAIGSSGGHGSGLYIRTQPKPVFFIAGERDTIVPFAGQMRSLESLRRFLKTDVEKATVKGKVKVEPGPEGIELATYIHSGGHEWPAAANQLLVEFFQRHPKK
jgi:polyhydroxybutyrate depolymerase